MSDAPDFDSDPNALHRRKMEEGVEWCHRLSRDTQNPIYAWMAVMYRAWGVRLPKAADDEPVADLTIPGWCAEYFADIAQSLVFLALGHDPRQDSAEVVAGNTPASVLSEDEAMNLVAREIGFTRQGYNAFKEYRSIQEKIMLFREFQDLKNKA